MKTISVKKKIPGILETAVTVPVGYSVYNAANLVGVSVRHMEDLANGVRIPADGIKMTVERIHLGSGRFKKLIPLYELQRIFPGLWPATPQSEGDGPAAA